LPLGMLKRTLAEAPVVKKGDYDYVVHPITDGIPAIEPGLLEEVTAEMLRIGNFDCDRIVTPEAMGIPLATSLSLKTGIPFTILRKRSYGLPGERSVAQVTGYSRSSLSINGLGRGDRVTFVDDVLSTGGTLRAIIKALQHMGVELVDIVIVIEKSFGAGLYEESRREAIQREFDVRIKALCTF